MLAQLPQDYRRYIATFMHPVELDLKISNDALVSCIEIGWRAGVETILQSELNIYPNISQLASSMPELLLKYPSWRGAVVYGEPVVYEFISKITVAGYELEYADWRSHVSSVNFRIMVINAASQVGNTALMHKIKNLPGQDITPYLKVTFAIEHNQLDAVLLMLSWGADLFNIWMVTVRLGRLKIMQNIPRLTNYNEICMCIDHALKYNQLQAVAYLGTSDGLLRYTFICAIKYSHISIAHQLWNRYEELRDDFHVIVANSDLQYLLW